MELNSGNTERMRRVLRHRLLNIMAGVKSANSLLASELDDRMTPREREYFPLIQRECDEVCNIMDRLDAFLGALSEPEPSALQGIIASSMTDIQAHNPLFEIDIELNVSDPSQRVCSFALSLVLHEALGNACEISRKPIAVVISDADAGCLVRVVDQGKPLSDEVCELAFEPFYTTRTRHLGLGLAIAKRRLEALGGTASISTGAEGNVVEFRLPYM